MTESEAPATIEFEAALQELEGIVQLLERGQPTLDQSLRSFERGVELLRLCRSSLDQADLRIRELVDIDENGNARLRPFTHEATVSKPPPANSKSASEPITPETRRPRRKKEELSQEPDQAQPQNEDDFLF